MLELDRLPQQEKNVSPIPQDIAAVVRRGISAAQAAGALPTFDIPVLKIDRPKQASQGDYASAVALQIQKQVGRPPNEIARTIQAHLPQVPFVGAVEVAPPGFLNFRLSDVWLAQQVDNIIGAGD